MLGQLAAPRLPHDPNREAANASSEEVQVRAALGKFGFSRRSEAPRCGALSRRLGDRRRARGRERSLVGLSSRGPCSRSTIWICSVWRPRRDGRRRAAPEDRCHPPDRASPRRFVTALTALSNSSARSGVSAAWVSEEPCCRSESSLSARPTTTWSRRTAPSRAPVRCARVSRTTTSAGQRRPACGLASERLRSVSPARSMPLGSIACSPASIRRVGSRSGASCAAGCLAST